MSRNLYIFLDEGGNFDFSPKGTKYFTLTAVSRDRPFEFHDSLDSLRHDLIEKGLDLQYFHASEDRQHVRDAVFDVIAQYLPERSVDSLIVEKRKTGPSLRPVEHFYPRMLGYLLKYVIEGKAIGNYSEVIVLTDRIPVTKKRRAVEGAIKKTLSRMLPSGITYRVLHHESKSSYGLQIADYCNWAIYRKWNAKDTRSFDPIASKVRSEFDIFRNGTTY